jgi:hypothetical protein
MQKCSIPTPRKNHDQNHDQKARAKTARQESRKKKPARTPAEQVAGVRSQQLVQSPAHARENVSAQVLV